MMSTSNLMISDCNSVAQINDLFITNGLLVLRHMKRCCLATSFTIPSGCYALVTCSGADLDYIDEGGRKHAVWPAGLHFPYPSWTGVSFFVTKRSTIIDIPVPKCITKDNISINVDMALTFRIMGDPDLGEDSNLVRKFVYELTPCGLQHQLQDANEKAIRAIIRLVNHSKIYGIRSIRLDLDSGVNAQGSSVNRITDRGIRPVRSSQQNLDDRIKIGGISGSKISDVESSMQIDSSMQISSSEESKHDDPTLNIMTANQVVATVLNEKFNVLGVEIQSVAIKNIVLSPESQLEMEKKVSLTSNELNHDDDLRNSKMEDKLFEETNHEYEAGREERNLEDKNLSDLRNSQMEDEILLVRQKILEEINHEHQAGREERNVEEVKLNDEISQGNKLGSLIRQETKVRIENFIAQNNYEIQSVKDMTAAGTAAIEMKTKKLTVQQLADAKLERDSSLAEATVRSLAIEVEAEKLFADTEGMMASWLKKKNEFITQLKKIEVYEKLATNASLIMTNSVDSDTNYMAVAGKILDDNDADSDETSASSIAIEVGILERLSRSYKHDVESISHDEELGSCFSEF